MKHKKVILIVCLAVVSFLAAIVGLSYSYFKAMIYGNEEASVVLIEAVRLGLKYEGGPEIRLENALPSYYVEKTFTVTNEGLERVSFAINLENIINSYVNDEIVVSYTCESIFNKGKPNETQPVECQELDEVSLGNLETISGTANKRLAVYIPSLVNETKRFRVKIQFKDTGSKQNYNQGKTFSTVIKIEGFPNSYGFNGKIVDEQGNNLNNYYIKIDDKETNSDSSGKYILSGIELGNNAISIYDSSHNLIGSHDIQLIEGNEEFVNNNIISANVLKDTVKLKLVLSDNDFSFSILPTLLSEKIISRVERDGLVSISHEATELQNYETTEYRYQGGNGEYCSLEFDQTNCDRLGGEWTSGGGIHYCLVDDDHVYYFSESHCITLDGNWYTHNDDPSNYIYYNCKEQDSSNNNYGSSNYDYATSCEKWRIIGVFDVDTPIGTTPETYRKEQRVKIIRNEILDGTLWRIRSPLAGQSWSNWESSTVREVLNGLYYTATSDSLVAFWSGVERGSYSYDYTTTGLTSIARGQIEPVKWYLGNSERSYNVETSYIKERTGTSNVHGTNPTTYDANIGLMYPSDYGYASSECYNSKTNTSLVNLRNYNRDECRRSNYLFINSGREFLMNISSLSDIAALAIGEEGYVAWVSVSMDSSWFRGVTYLKSGIEYVSGNGMESNPYIIGLGN